MSYTYEYTYPKNKEAAGYSGPVPILIDTDTYVPGLMEGEPCDKCKATGTIDWVTKMRRGYDNRNCWF